MKKVVVLGGGHGLAALLKGLKLFPITLTAIVAVSDDEKELQEVNNKLGALRKAIEMAGEIK